MDSCCHFIGVDILVVVRIGFANVIVETIPLFVLDIFQLEKLISCGCYLKNNPATKGKKIKAES